MRSKRRMQNGECRMKCASVLRVFTFCILHSAFCICTVGCNVIGAIAAKTAPDPTMSAQFVPEKKPTAVIVENFHNPAALRMESDAIARQVIDEFKRHDVAPVVEASAIENLRQRKGAAYRSMAIDAIAREVGATQVVYVDVEQFELVQAVGSEAPGAKAEARVRLVDADSGETLWPLDAAGGFPIMVKIDPRRVTPEAPDAAVKRMLHEQLADRVAKLFYSWKSDTSDGSAETFGQ